MASLPRSIVQVTSKLSAAELMQAIIEDPLPNMFVKWGPFPAVTSYELLDGSWQVGNRRTVFTSDGNKMLEQFVSVSSEAFAYKLTRLEGFFGWLLAQIDDLWDFDGLSVGSGVTWAWQLTPKPGRKLLVVLFARLWQVYAQKILRASVRRLEAARGI